MLFSCDIAYLVLRIGSVSPEPMLFAQVNGRSRGNFSQRTRCDLAKGPGMHTERLI